MKTRQFLRGSAKSLIGLVLTLFSAADLFAQDAFYVYRNDGNFDGFFFDEVERMGYSKFDLDSIEHNVYMVQEIQTADSLYRIPLASIDSIGFQQPEIKMSPNAKFVCQSGLLPYIQHASNGYIEVYNLPRDLMPRVGDVLIGLPTDENASELYTGGSFSCVVETRENDPYDFNRIYISGHAIENISDVFDQYITVEDISVDQQGRVHRRIAGCDKNGIPRRASEGSGEITVFDINGTFQREWNPTSESTISLSADVGVKLKMRVAYNIGWSRFFVKLSRDLIIKAKPSISMGLKESFEGSIADIIGLPSIMFPASCPVFQTDPIPEIFLRAEGTLSATVNLPAVKFGFGDDIILDTDQLFPVSYGMHWVPEADEVDEDMLDLSAGVSLSGFFQTGIKFAADLKTARWFRKILFGEIGFYLYCGPKVGASAEISADVMNNTEGINMYDVLSNVNFNVAWLSLDLEAKATAAALWKDPVQKTFFSKNWSFFTDTLGFVPLFNKTAYEVNGQDVTVTVYPRRTTFAYNHIDIGVYKLPSSELVKTIGGWTYKKFPKEDDPPYAATTTLEPGTYYARPRVTWGTQGPYNGPHESKNNFVIWPDSIKKVDLTISFNASQGGYGGKWGIPVQGVRNGNTYTITGNSEFEHEIDGHCEGSVQLNVEIVDGKAQIVNGAVSRTCKMVTTETHTDGSYDIETRTVEESYDWDFVVKGTAPVSGKIEFSQISGPNISGYQKITVEYASYDKNGGLIGKDTEEQNHVASAEDRSTLMFSLYY